MYKNVAIQAGRAPDIKAAAEEALPKIPRPPRVRPRVKKDPRGEVSYAPPKPRKPRARGKSEWRENAALTRR